MSILSDLGTAAGWALRCHVMRCHAMPCDALRCHALGLRARCCGGVAKCAGVFPRRSERDCGGVAHVRGCCFMGMHVSAGV
eukprot:362191-Chlamydomonas_euryale.AAC.9